MVQNLKALLRKENKTRKTPMAKKSSSSKLMTTMKEIGKLLKLKNLVNVSQNSWSKIQT